MSLVIKAVCHSTVRHLKRTLFSSRPVVAVLGPYSTHMHLSIVHSICISLRVCRCVSLHACARTCPRAGRVNGTAWRLLCMMLCTHFLASTAAGGIRLHIMSLMSFRNFLSRSIFRTPRVTAILKAGFGLTFICFVSHTDRGILIKSEGASVLFFYRGGKYLTVGLSSHLPAYNAVAVIMTHTFCRTKSGPKSRPSPYMLLLHSIIGGTALALCITFLHKHRQIQCVVPFP